MATVILTPGVPFVPDKCALCGAKTVTRREWSPAYARSFSAGELVNAYEWPTNSPKTDSPSPAAT